MSRNTTLRADRAHANRRRRRRADRWAETTKRRLDAPYSQVKRLPRKQLERGTVVYARVPFEETDDYKIRPAVILHRCGRQVTVLPTTSAATRHRFPGRYVELSEPEAAGLERATGVRVEPIRLDVQELLDIVGAVSASDLQLVLAAARRAA